MKKFFPLFLLAILLIFISDIKAQTTFSLGARAGINFANASVDPEISKTNKSSRTGFKFGALAEIGFIPMLALQIEPMYATGGTEITGPIQYTNNDKITYKLSYLEIPILLKVKIPIKKSSFVPYAFLGPNVAFIMSSKLLFEAPGVGSSETDMKDYSSSVSLGLDFGGGGSYKITPSTTVMLDVRYSLGLSNILNDKGKQYFGNDQSIKPNGLQIVAGAMFEL
jgi:hypothetical protein